MADFFAHKFFELLPLFVSDALREGIEGDAAFLDPMLQLIGGVGPVNFSVGPDDLENSRGIKAHAGVIAMTGDDWFR